MSNNTTTALQTVSTEVKHDGNAHRTALRLTVTFALWGFGVLAILGSLVSLSLLIIVPIFSLENALWERANNPHTIANVFLGMVLGTTAIFAARSSGRVRVWLVVGAFLAFLGYGLYELGLFGG